MAKSKIPKTEKAKIKKPKTEKAKIKKPKTEKLIGPPKLTRFEKARIIGTRALQLSLGAPPFVEVTPEIRSSIDLAKSELVLKVLPISIRRILPNNKFQDIPIDILI